MINITRVVRDIILRDDVLLTLRPACVDKGHLRTVQKHKKFTGGINVDVTDRRPENEVGTIEIAV